MPESNKLEPKTLIVIGGGAAGFFCAINAAKNCSNLKIIILEKTSKLLSKVKVSGGGRCNVTHACFDIHELIKNYPRGKNFLKKAFHQFNTTHTINWFKENGVELITEPDGRMFPASNSSQSIINCLINQINKYKIDVMLNAEVAHLKKNNSSFDLILKNSRTISADFICVACGGFAKVEQFNWIKNLGHTIEKPVPSLFTFNLPESGIKELMGVSLNMVKVKILESKFTYSGPILITHWGLSGPVILKLSAFAAGLLAERNYQFSISVNWLNDKNENDLQKEWALFRKEFGAIKLSSKNPFELPQRLWIYLLQTSNIGSDIRYAELKNNQQNLLIKNLTSSFFEVKGKTTFKEEFVTAGGVKLNEIEPSTMESKLVENLFFAGEIMDVDGITGGFNFQHAWSSGFIAAKGISIKINNP